MVLEPVQFDLTPLRLSPQKNVAPPSPYSTHGHSILAVSKEGPNRRVSIPFATRPNVVFTKEDLDSIDILVDQSKIDCEHESDGKKCIICREQEYAYQLTKIMATSMPPEERSKVIEQNRSLRTIKTELDNLFQSEALSGEAYDLIMSNLPSESVFNRSASSRNVAPSPTPTPGPPSYSKYNVMISVKLILKNVESVQQNPPPLPGRKASSKGPSKPEIARGTALYAYPGDQPANKGDCSFEVEDTIIIMEFVNNDWWSGHNVRTGSEGIFPQIYIQKHQPVHSGDYYATEKGRNSAAGYPGQYQQQAQASSPTRQVK